VKERLVICNEEDTDGRARVTAETCRNKRRLVITYLTIHLLLAAAAATDAAE